MKMLKTKVATTYSISWLLSTIWLFTLWHSPSVFAIQREDFPVPDDYALEFSDQDGTLKFIDVTAAKGNVWVRYEFKRIKNWQRPAEQTADPSAIQLKCRREGNTIKIDLSVIFGSTADSPSLGKVFRTLPCQGLRGRLIGSYAARLGESLSLQELAVVS